MYHALIMAGGTGTRMWPLSRRDRPKQSLQLIGGRTMFQAAVDRLDPLFPPERIHVVTRSEHVESLQQQAPQVPAHNFVVEPEGRGTAPAIGLAAVHLCQRDEDATMAVLTADQHIADTARFRASLEAAAQVAAQGHLVTLGIRPTEPATGYGYIKQGARHADAGDFQVYSVDRFAEKPDLETARSMLASGEYAWNAGMFIWRVQRVLAELERHMPALYQQLMVLHTVAATPRYNQQLHELWPQVKKQTIDYGVMEKADDIVVIPVDMGWSDVGSWTSLMKLLKPDAAGNVSVGSHLSLDTRNSFVYSSKRTVATIGLEDMVIVETEDALLVCPREREQEVRSIVELLETEGPAELL
jgi:mannose-1-phosphate guanylyltransferase